MVVGLMMFGLLVFLDDFQEGWIQALVLAFEGIALSLVMVPCMLEVKISGGNYVSAAFIYELGYSVNILLWGLFKSMMVDFPEQAKSLAQCACAIGFAIIYVLFGLGLPSVRERKSEKFQKFDDEKS